MLKPFGKVMLGLSANLIALAAAGWVGWDAWQRGILEGYKTPPPKIEPVSVAVTRTTYNINAIIQAHLFGAPNQVKKVVQKKAAPPTRLNLRLVGVIAAGNDSNALALIEVTRGKQEVIRVGDSIGKTGATLSRVENDHVLIERNGKLEKLAIKRPGLKNQKTKPLDVGQNNLAAVSKPVNRVAATTTPAQSNSTNKSSAILNTTVAVMKSDTGANQTRKAGKMTLPF